jgi:hypothetical protein
LRGGQQFGDAEARRSGDLAPSDRSRDREAQDRSRIEGTTGWAAWQVGVCTSANCHAIRRATQSQENEVKDVPYLLTFSPFHPDWRFILSLDISGELAYSGTVGTDPALESPRTCLCPQRLSSTEFWRRLRVAKTLKSFGNSIKVLRTGCISSLLHERIKLARRPTGKAVTTKRSK